jgi:transposase-like protein
MIQEKNPDERTTTEVPAEFKARVVMDMLTGQKSASQASREYGIKDSVYRGGSRNL